MLAHASVFNSFNSLVLHVVTFLSQSVNNCLCTCCTLLRTQFCCFIIIVDDRGMVIMLCVKSVWLSLVGEQLVRALISALQGLYSDSQPISRPVDGCPHL